MLVHHAKRELQLAGLDTDEDYDGLIYKSIMELIECFASQGHSGGSAAIVIDLFSKLSNGENLTPLDNNQEDWVDVTEYFVDHQPNPTFQSLRNSAWFSYDGLKTATNVITNETIWLIPNLVEVGNGYEPCAVDF
jgi:hypothetical protein